MTTSQISDCTRATTTPSPATHIILSEDDRTNVARMIETLKACMDAETSETLVQDVITQLTNMPGSDSAETLRPLVKCLPPAVAARLPDILRLEGASAKTVVLSSVGREVLFRVETAITFGTMFLALTDLESDAARQMRTS
jgi:hypothetical protein